MELKIGQNIKRLRCAQGMTQEKLARLVNVSCASVSKWETGDTYPDITLLFPLAQIFGVSVDELMGYDAAKTKEEIENILTDYRELQMAGKFAQATALLQQARKTYPHDYRIMHAYMWNLAGGAADNNPDILNTHADELMHICNCILDGCTHETTRLDAMTMKAKLLHAAGHTDEALEILQQFPSWYHTAGQKSEQLFAKETPAFRYWLCRNLYELLDGTANKMVKRIWYDNNRTMEERIACAEALGDMFAEIRCRDGMTYFVIAEHMAFSELAGKLTFSGGNSTDIIRLRDKQLAAAEAVTIAAEHDDVLCELLLRTYKTKNLLQWTVDWLMTSEHDPLVRLREIPGYREMLNKHRAVIEEHP